MKKKRHYPNSDFKTDTYYKKDSFKRQISKAIKSGKETYFNTVRKLNNLPQARKERGHISIKDILKDNWSSFKSKHINKLQRDGLIKGVERTLECGSFEKGFLYFECPKCDNFHVQGFTCKSRFWSYLWQKI